MAPAAKPSKGSMRGAKIDADRDALRDAVEGHGDEDEDLLARPDRLYQAGTPMAVEITTDQPEKACPRQDAADDEQYLPRRATVFTKGQARQNQIVH